MFDDLTDKNIELYMMKYYENPQCLDLEEYNDDIKRIKYIKRLFNRYENTGDLKERLILNHIIVLYNVYDIEVATRILFFKNRYQNMKLIFARNLIFQENSTILKDQEKLSPKSSCCFFKKSRQKI